MFPEPVNFLGMSLHLFGLFAAVAIVLGCRLTYLELRRMSVQTDLLPDLAFAVLISSFVGARIFFIVMNFGQYLNQPAAVLKFWEGGLVLYGGLAGGFLGGLFFCRRHSLDFSRYSDAVALGLALGLAVGRLGCLAAGCCYGFETHAPWGVVFSNAQAVARPLHIPLHPTQLYLFTAEISILAALFLTRHKEILNGRKIWIYLLLASGTRLVISPFRADLNIFLWTLPALFFIVSLLKLQKDFKLLTLNRGGHMQLKPYLKLSFLTLAVLVFAACGIITTNKVSRGHDISESSVNKIAKGSSTEKDVIKLFGPPAKVRDTEEGKEFFYEYAKTGGPRWNLIFSVGGSTVTKSLLVWMDKNGVVTDYAYKKN